jgi:GNAT superfamily N-acetyltransferase
MTEPEPMPAQTGPSLRRARADEADAITQLVLRSKRTWGYDRAFMAAAKPELTLRAQDLQHPGDVVEVLESHGRLLAMYRLRREPSRALLVDLFVDPEHMGRGHGRLLFERAIELARGWGLTTIELESDPHAEPFYQHLGAVRVGWSASATAIGRQLPLMRYVIESLAPPSGA